MSDDVTEGGKAPSPTERPGAPKPASSTAHDAGVPEDETSPATQGAAEKQHAAEMGAAKTQTGRGHRKD